MQLLNFLIFFVLVFVIIYLPGRLLLRLSGYKFSSFLITFSTSLIVGLAAFLLFNYLLSWLKMPLLYAVVIFFVFLLECKNTFHELKNNLKIKNFSNIESVLIFFGTMAMAYTTWNSGTFQNGGMLFYGVNAQDSIYHLALIGSLISNFPPFHPGLSGVYLRGYNFFYDFLNAIFAGVYHLNPFDLFFRFFPLFISLAFGLTSLSLAKFLKWKRITALLFIFLMYFVQNFDFFAYYIYRAFNYYYNSSGITQSFANALDPSIVISVSFILIGFVLLFSKGRRWSFLLPVLVIGVIPQIKIYSGIVFYLGLLAAALWELIRHKDFQYLKILSFSAVISAFVYLPLNYGAGGLLFAPLLIYKNFINSAWIFNNWHWSVDFPIYIKAGNYLHLTFFYLVATAIFLLTSLGIRILILLDIKRIFNKKLYNSGNIFWGASILGSLLIPSFFIQSVSGFSIIQFFWVGYIILLIPTAYVLGEKLEKAKKIILVAVVLVLIFLFLPDTVRVIGIYSYNPSLVGKDMIRQTSVISKIPQNEGVIVADRVKIKGKYQDVYESPIISALSGRPVYYEHELTAFGGLDKITDVRKDNVDKIDENMVNCSNPTAAEQNIIDIMRKSDNKYLLILKKNKCTQKFNKLKIVNEEEASVLFKI